MRVAQRLVLILLTIGVSWAGDPQFSTFFGGSAGEFAAGVAADPQGNVYIAGQTGSADLPVSANAFQSKYAGASDAFVAKYSPQGALLWATYYGGSGSDGARAIAVDPNGNVLVAGTTGSLDLPLMNPISSSLDGGHVTYGIDAFVLKLDTNGNMVYSTYLGGRCSDWAWAIASDSQGNAYVTGDSCSSDFPTSPAGIVDKVNQFSPDTFMTKLDPTGRLVYSSLLNIGSPRGIAVDAAGAAYITGIGGILSRAFVVKLTPDGSAMAYHSTFGGSLGDWGLGIAVDSGGSAYVTGVTQSADFPTVNALQSSFGARTLWRSIDDGATWAVIEDSPLGQVTAVVPDPQNAGAVYAATIDGGVFKSRDNGNTWVAANNGLTPACAQALAMDARNSSVLYAATGSVYYPVAQRGLYKSTDGAATWRLIDASQSPTVILVDPSISGTVYTFDGAVLEKSTDGGSSWSKLPAPQGIFTLALDPNAPGVVYAAAYLFYSASAVPFFYRSADGGETWKSIPQAAGVKLASRILVDSSQNPSIVYAGEVARSDDGGITWTPINTAATPVDNAAIDPASGALIGVAGFPGNSIGLYVSSDRGMTWQPAAGTPVSGPAYVVPGISAVTPSPTSPGVLFATVTPTQTSAFVARLSADGTQLLFSTYLHGHPSMDASQNIGGGNLMPPQSATGSNFATGIALDPQGNIAIAGATRTVDFPTVNAWQNSNAGQYDVFAAVLAADGSALNYSTYIGGGLNEMARGIVVDQAGNLILAGQTFSGDFPSFHAAQVEKGLADDAFVIKVGR